MDTLFLSYIPLLSFLHWAAQARAGFYFWAMSVEEWKKIPRKDAFCRAQFCWHNSSSLFTAFRSQRRKPWLALRPHSYLCRQGNFILFFCFSTTLFHFCFSRGEKNWVLLSTFCVFLSLPSSSYLWRERRRLLGASKQKEEKKEGRMGEFYLVTAKFMEPASRSYFLRPPPLFLLFGIILGFCCNQPL